MTKASRHPELAKWLIANASRPFYWTSLANARGVECATAAMSDLHRMVANDTDEEIAEFFSSVRNQIRQQAAQTSMDSEHPPREWPIETD